MTKRDLNASLSAMASVRSVDSGFSSLASMDQWYNHRAIVFAMAAKRFAHRVARPADLGLEPREFAVLRHLRTPRKIQAYLHGLKQNFEVGGETCQPVREV